MKLEHSFTVPAELDTVWQAVLDPERVAPCMPGATLAEVNGDSFTGSVKVKVGPISLLYKGSGEFLTKDADARTVVIKASGKDARGNGTASATVTVTLRAEGSSTVGSVETDLAITGKPAQFGRGLISEVGGKILDSFAACLASKLAPADQEPAAPAPDLSVVPEPSDASAESSSARAKSSGAKSSAEDSSGPEPVVPESEVAKAAATGREAGEAAAGPASTVKRKLAAAPEPENDPIDLLAYAGPSVLKRAAPVVAGVIALLVIIGLRRRR